MVENFRPGMGPSAAVGLAQKPKRPVGRRNRRQFRNIPRGVLGNLKWESVGSFMSTHLKLPGTGHLNKEEE